MHSGGREGAGANLTERDRWVTVSTPEQGRTGSVLHADLGCESKVKFSCRKSSSLLPKKS